MNCTFASSGSRGHEQHRLRDVPDVERRLRPHPPVRLTRSSGDPGRHVRGGVADVDLPAGDVVRAPVQRQRLRQPGDRVLRRGVGGAARPRGVRGDRPVVDDPPARGAPAPASRRTPPVRTGTSRSGSSRPRRASPRPGSRPRSPPGPNIPALLTSRSTRPQLAAHRGEQRRRPRPGRRRRSARPAPRPRPSAVSASVSGRRPASATLPPGVEQSAGDHPPDAGSGSRHHRHVARHETAP